MTPVTKYWVCKIAPALVYEAMECLGGNGYVEEAPLARLYREVPVNAIWEGSGNVMALDVLRVLQREPEPCEIVMDELARRRRRRSAPEGALHARLQACCTSRGCSTRAGARSPRRWRCWRPARSCARMRPPRSPTRSSRTRLSGAPRQTYGQGLEWADVARHRRPRLAEPVSDTNGVILGLVPRTHGSASSRSVIVCVAAKIAIGGASGWLGPRHKAEDDS